MTIPKISKCVQELAPSGIRAFFELVIGMKDIISLGVGEPDFDTPWPFRESAIFSIERGHTTYTSNKGLLDLRKLISRQFKSRHGLDYDPDTEILITVGVSEAMDLAVRALLDPGERVLIPQPCYVSYLPLVALAGGEPVYISTAQAGRFKICAGDISKFKSRRPKGMILNYPSNPTGVSYTKDELRSLAHAVKALDLFVISDEIYSDLTYDFNHTPFPCVAGMKERTILVNGFSKAYAMTGWRVGYVAGPAHIIEAMNKIHQYTIMCAPIMGQWAACEALKNGGSAVVEMRQEYERRRNFIVEELNAIGLSCPLPQGAFYAFPSVRKTGMDSVSFARRLLETKKVAVVPGTAFGPDGEGFVRMSYATSIENIKEAMKRIGGFLQAL